MFRFGKKHKRAEEDAPADHGRALALISRLHLGEGDRATSFALTSAFVAKRSFGGATG